jgi:hypothetical protein
MDEKYSSGMLICVYVCTVSRPRKRVCHSLMLENIIVHFIDLMCFNCILSELHGSSSQKLPWSIW